MSATGPVLLLLAAPVPGEPVGAPGTAAGLTQQAAELLTVGRRVAAGLGAPLEVVWVGPLADDVPGSLGAFGAARVRHVAERPASTAAFAASLTELARSTWPVAFLATTSFEARELAARLGSRLGAGVLVDAAALDVVDGRLEASRTSFAATWGSRCAVVATPAVVTVKPHAATPEPAPEPVTPDVVPLAPGEPGTRVRVVDRTERVATGRPDLASAAVVVAGGRGTGGDFTPLEELAQTLGAALGATRDATDEGWTGHEMQIGQTGVTVNPVLYIGAGVSGAVHHVGGMRAARTIVAINTDADAPLMEIADYAVVGDLFDVVPQLTERLRELREGS